MTPTPAQMAYETSVIVYDGTWPAWADLPDETRDRWTAAAAEALRQS